MKFKNVDTSGVKCVKVYTFLEWQKHILFTVNDSTFHCVPGIEHILKDLLILFYYFFVQENAKD